MDKLVALWQRCNPREQIMLVIGAVIIALLLLYSLVLSPLTEAVANAEQQSRAQQTLALWLQPRVAALTSQRSTIVAVPASQLLSTISTQIKQTSFVASVKALSQTNGTDVQITLQAVPFDDLSAWLLSLWQRSHIQVTEFSAQKTDKPGLVDATVVLTV